VVLLPYPPSLNGYVSLCPELDIASQGENVEAARQNLAEALELFFEHASESEIKERLPFTLSAFSFH
jgi:predicted RNase H-like HicB family nuclease